VLYAGMMTLTSGASTMAYTRSNTN
jgi:hypothetical protein